MKLKLLSSLARKLAGKTVLLRIDLNVPFKDGTILDTTRIDHILPTLDFLKKENAKTIIVSHLGRPKGKVNSSLSLAPIAKYMNINFLDKSLYEISNSDFSSLENGETVLLENIRFYPEETQNNADFSKKLASFADIFVNDGFSVSHRMHASTEGVTHHLNSYAGLEVEKEISTLNSILESPARPLVVLLGGAKVKTKIPLIKKLLPLVDFLFVGGASANTFLKAQGYEIGKSLFEKEMLNDAQDILKFSKKSRGKLMLPLDVSVLRNGKDLEISIDDVLKDDQIFDLGSETIKRLEKSVLNAQTILWNGPLGFFERPPFNEGTNKMLSMIATQTKEQKLTSVIGGGDMISALNQNHSLDDFSYVSTAGGAFLTYLEKKNLPALIPLMEKNNA